MKGLETYIAIIVLASVIIFGLVVVLVQELFTGKLSMPFSISSELAKVRAGGCGSDVDCGGSGVCVSARCTCFDDSQCKTSCDKSTGKCS